MKVHALNISNIGPESSPRKKGRTTENVSLRYCLQIVTHLHTLLLLWITVQSECSVAHKKELNLWRAVPKSVSLSQWAMGPFCNRVLIYRSMWSQLLINTFESFMKFGPNGANAWYHHRGKPESWRAPGSGRRAAGSCELSRGEWRHRDTSHLPHTLPTSCATSYL